MRDHTIEMNASIFAGACSSTSANASGSKLFRGGQEGAMRVPVVVRRVLHNLVGELRGATQEDNERMLREPNPRRGPIWATEE